MDFTNVSKINNSLKTEFATKNNSIASYLPSYGREDDENEREINCEN